MFIWFTQKPTLIKAIVLLLCTYAMLIIVSSYVYAYYVQTSVSGFFSIDLTPSIGSWIRTVYFIIRSLIVTPLLLAAFLILRGKRWGYQASVALMLISVPVAISGISYLLFNTPPLIIADPLYLMHTPPFPHTMNYFLDMSVDHSTYVDNLGAYRVLIIKSFLKAIIEIVSCGLLIKIVNNYRHFFKLD